MEYFAVFCLIVPSLFWGLFLLINNLRLKRAVGVIVDHDVSQGDTDTMTAEIVEFETPDGKKHTIKGIYSNETFIETILDAVLRRVQKKDENQVVVLYDPRFPEKARINNFKNLYFLPLLLFVIGLCMFLNSIPLIHDLIAPVLNILDKITKIL